LAEQGITVDLVNSACDEARGSKPNETIGLAYVLAIIDRWAKAASTVQVGGVQRPNARASPQRYESEKDKARRMVSEQLTGRKSNEQHCNIIDIN
jgi:hypothetical protein